MGRVNAMDSTSDYITSHFTFYFVKIPIIVYLPM